MRIAGFLLLLSAFLLICFNILSGLRLAFRELQSPETHLFQAIGIVLATIIGHLLLFRSSGKLIETRQLEILENKKEAQKEKINQLYKIKQSCFPSALAAILICLVSLVTGTISHPGQFPVLHGGLGFLLFIASLVAGIQWLRLFANVK